MLSTSSSQAKLRRAHVGRALPALPVGYDVVDHAVTRLRQVTRPQILVPDENILAARVRRDETVSLIEKPLHGTNFTHLLRSSLVLTIVAGPRCVHPASASLPRAGAGPIQFHSSRAI